MAWDRRRVLALAAGLLLAQPAAQAYYYFVQYLTRNAPYTAAYSKFDVNALPNRTVPYLIAENGPSQMVAGDSFAALVSQIRLAAKAWSDVESSSLKLAFGGLSAPGAVQSTPAIEIVFDELTPGELARGGPSMRADPVDPGNGPFVPILKSTVVLPATMQAPSWSESFFLTLTHELGHAIGLQHSLTSSVMSTSITRATTKARPLAVDDVVGISMLYPSTSSPLAGGTISGRVSMGSNGAHLASVVALSLDGAAVSALSNPDGTYRIEGVPMGTYFLYAHPLPPAVFSEAYAAGIIPPVDSAGRLLTAGQAFETQFYAPGSGTREVERAQAVAVFPGSVLDNINFTVNRRNAPAVYGVQTYSFPGQVAVKPAHLSTEGGRNFILAAGFGLNDKAGVSVMGGAAVIPNGGIKPYSLDPRYVQLDFLFNLVSGEGTRHLTFAADNDLYVLPAAFRMTRRQPPQVLSAIPTFDSSGSRVVVVAGNGFTSSTQILFDGLVGVVRNFDESSGAFTLIPPAGSFGQRSSVVALNRGDGQSSLFLQSTPLMLDLEGSDAGSITISPSQAPAGAESMVEILGGGTSFSPHYAAVALGSSGVSVRRWWVTGPNRIIAVVAVSPEAAPGASTVSVLNGLRSLHLRNSFQIAPASGRVSYFRGLIADALSGRTEIPAGGLATARLAGPLADQPAASLQLTVGDRAATIVSSSGGQLTFRVPSSLTPGPAVVRLASGADAALPSVISIDLPPPQVTGIVVSGSKVDALRPARPGELLTVTVNGMSEAGADVLVSRVTVYVGTSPHAVASVQAGPNGGHSVQFILDSSIGAGTHPLVVSSDGRISPPVSLVVRVN